MNRDFLDYAEDIMDAVSKVEKFTKDMEYEDFVRDDKTIFAVIRALEIIGEAAKRLPPSVKNRYPAIPWKDIAGMRNKLTHEYFGVNLKVVWSTVKQDIPALRSLIQKLLDDFERKVDYNDTVTPPRYS